MANGTITLDTPKSTVAGYIKWTSEASSATNNYSLVSAYVYLKKTDGYTSWGDFSGKLTINGTSYSFSKNATLGSSYVLMTSKTGVRVNHDSDGTKKITISTSFKNSGTTIAGTYSASKTVTLDTIKRLSYISGSVDIAAGQPFTVNINRYSADYVHDIAIKVGGNVVREAKGYGEKVTFSSESYQSSIFAALDGSLSKACTVVLTTRSGNTEIGSASYSGTITAASPGELMLSKSSVLIGESQGVAVENPSDLYSYSANYQFAGFEGSVSLISSAGVLPVGESFAVNMPGNVNEASCLVTMTASYAGITVGQPETMDFTVRLPDSYRVVSFDQNSAVCAFLDTALTGSSAKFINGAGTLRLSIQAASKAEALYQASIIKYQVTMGSQSKELTEIPASGDLTLELTGGTGKIIELLIMDSRGNTKLCHYAISDENFIDYTSLKVAECRIYRENGFDTAVKMHVKGTAWEGNFGLQSNGLKITYTVKKSGTSTVYGPFTLSNIPIASGGGFERIADLDSGTAGGFDTDAAYEIHAQVSDCLKSYMTDVVVNSGMIGMYLKRNNDNYHVGINCKPDASELDASSEKAGLSVKGGLELIGADDQVSGIYTDTSGRLCVEPALGSLILSGSLQMPDGSPITVGAGRVPVVTQQGSNFVEMNLGAYILRMNWGTITVKVSETNTPVATALSYKSNFFTEAPFVTVTPRTGVIGSVVKGVSFNNNTADGCDIFVNRTNTTAFSVIWKAISITTD